jgi:NAD(P)-dependent dehydrogenase (short-subunit alcohol dehydrogenase family)
MSDSETLSTELSNSPMTMSNRTLDVNTVAHFWTLKAFLPAMIKEKTGHVVRTYVCILVAAPLISHQVTISSVMGFVGAARVVDYVASKFALVGLHESLRYELDSVCVISKVPHGHTHIS